MKIQLYDNHEKELDVSTIGEQGREFLRYLSDKSVKDLVNDGLLVYPSSFITGDVSSSVLSYKETEKSLSIRTNNLLGIIGKGDSQIMIRSRFSNRDDDLFGQYMLARISRLSLFDLPVEYRVTQERVFDLLLFMFPKMLRSALSRGVLRMYVEKQYNDSRVRGILDIPRHIRLDEPFNGNAAYRVREYSTDNQVTELIRHCIEYMKTRDLGRSLLCSDENVRSDVDAIVNATPSYDRSRLEQVIYANMRTAINPLYSDYVPLQHLCINILMHRDIEYLKGENRTYGLLFDGAWLWEEYLATVLDGIMKHCRRQGGFDLFEDEKGGFQNIVPDFISVDGFDSVFSDGNKGKVIADAKYIPLGNRYRDLKGDSASAVYYKTMMYMYRFRSSDGMLIYPERADACSSELVKEKILNVKETPGKLHIIGVRVSNSNDYATFVEDMSKSEALLVSKVNSILL